MKRLLIVDDNMAALKYTASQLQDTYSVIPAKSGAQALDIAAREAVDMIILDIEMPDMDGFETMARLKNIPSASRIPVIFLTGNHDPETQVRALETGGVDFVKKPFEKGVLLHRIELHLNLFEYQQNLEKTAKNIENTIVSSFADLIEWRSRHSETHLWKANLFMTILGRMLMAKGLFPDELDEERLDMIVRGSSLYDVGKIGVSDEVLLKPGRLTPEEFEEIKKHTLIGAGILKKMYERTPTQHYLKYARVMAEGHHERFNGSGYPHGLSGNDIPLCCRLLAITNVYDSLLAETPYRPAMSPEEARVIIESGSGVDFDPTIVEVFLANYDEFCRIAAASSENAAKR